MQIIRGLINSGKIRAGCVATIGNFDGVHLGHQAVIRRLAEKGRELGLPIAVILFEPQPMEFFRPASAPPRLLRFREKMRFLRELPIDFVVVLRFEECLSSLEPDEFVQKVLVKGLDAKYVVVGDDFRFGNKRHGDFRLLATLADTAGFAVEDTGSMTVDGARVSSTLIRDALQAGDMSAARRLLGRDYSVFGRIVHGDENGRTIGYPTANIRMRRKKSPVDGVFAVTMSGISRFELPGVANVGRRPTVGSAREILLETHLFDFDECLYGQNVEVHFRERIRNELRFDSLSELKKQIAKDAQTARRILGVQSYAANERSAGKKV